MRVACLLSRKAAATEDRVAVPLTAESIKAVESVKVTVFRHDDEQRSWRVKSSVSVSVFAVSVLNYLATEGSNLL